MTARHVLARARGVAPGGGCDCRCCGASPFAAAGPWADLVGAGFTDHDALAAPSAAALCLGCRALLAGKPSKTDPPLRAFSLRVAGGRLERLDRAGVWAALQDPATVLLSWATSGQRHHWLRAELAPPGRLVIGSDAGPIPYDRGGDAPLLAAVAALTARPGGPSRADIRRGAYHPAAVQRLGIAVWAAAERAISPRRGAPLLDLLCWCAPGPPDETVHMPEKEEDEPMIDPVTHQAAALLAALARGSSQRARDGKAFWAGFLRHRVARFARRPLEACVARLMTELGVEPATEGAAAALRMLAGLDAATTTLVEAALRERRDLVIALAYEQRSLRAC